MTFNVGDLLCSEGRAGAGARFANAMIGMIIRKEYFESRVEYYIYWARRRAVAQHYYQSDPYAYPEKYVEIYRNNYHQLMRELDKKPTLP